MERKLKKDDKAREKALKKQKALEKARLKEMKANPKKKAEKKSGKGEENPEDFMDPETPLGERKKLSSQMAKHYSPCAVEKS